MPASSCAGERGPGDPAVAVRYGAVAQIAHWLVALLVMAAFAVGFTMVELKISPTRLKLFSYHKWIGVSVFALVVLRLAWRLYALPPPLPAQMPRWEQQAAQIAHRMLYLLLLAVPVSGWLMSSAKGFQTVWFGVWPIPDMLSKNPPLGAALEQVHFALNKLLLALTGLHVLAALKHHSIDRDGVLLRMLPTVRRTR